MTTTKSIYLIAGPAADPAVLNGLRGAGASVIQTQSIAQTISAITSVSHEHVVLVADVQADAITCLILLREYMGRLPLTLLIDQEGDNISYPIKAMQLGVAEYILASDPDFHRELSARLLIERSHISGRLKAPVVAERAVSTQPGLGFEWDPVSYVISCGDQYIRLSPAEGRLFTLLMANRGRTVGVRDLMRYALRKPDVELKLGLRQLRPHMMRLRRKLSAIPNLKACALSARAAWGICSCSRLVPARRTNGAGFTASAVQQPFQVEGLCLQGSLPMRGRCPRLA